MFFHQHIWQQLVFEIFYIEQGQSDLDRDDRRKCISLHFSESHKWLQHVHQRFFSTVLFFTVCEKLQILYKKSSKGNVYIYLNLHVQYKF